MYEIPENRFDLSSFFIPLQICIFFRRIRFGGKSSFSETFNIKDFFLEYESTLVCNAMQCNAKIIGFSR